jgi:hypothetical protein
MRGQITKLTGKRFGRLTVTGLSHIDKHAFWLCKCDCGANTTVRGTNLTRMKKPTKSCGCLQVESATTHGKRTHPLYNIWTEMNRRCRATNRNNSDTYSLKGISVCERWQGNNGFTNWLGDMGERPTDNHTLERIDNNKGYSPENCRWATKAEQNRNRSDTTRLVYNGKKMCAAELARIIGINPSTVRRRHHKGQSGDEIAAHFGY